MRSLPMKIINKIYEELKRNPMTVCIGIFGIIIATYLTVREDKTAISLEVIHELDVLNLQKNIKDLTIQFRGADMVKEGLTLTSLKIKIANIGDKHLKEEDFSTKIPWKLDIVNGEVHTVTSDADDDNLKKELEKINIFKGFVNLPILMFDKNKFFTLDILVLHKKNTPIKPVMDGKISGMDAFTYITKPAEKESKLSGFLKVTFQGGIVTQSVRFIVYFLGFLFLLFLLFLLFEYFENKKTDQIHLSRKKNIEQFFPDITNEPGGAIIIDVYLFNGKEGLKRLRDSIAPDVLNFSARAAKLEIDYHSRSEEIKMKSYSISINLPNVIGTALRNLITKSLIHQDGNNWELNEEFRNLLNESIEKV